MMYIQPYVKMERVTVSQEHSTSNVSERKHFRMVETSALINQVSRGIPENYKALGHHRDPVKRTSVIPVLHIVSVPINATCQFLILASNGL